MIVSKSGRGTLVETFDPVHREVVEPRKLETPVVAEKVKEVAAAAPSEAVEAKLDIARDGLVAIKAPMLGTFYRASKPGTPPFVEVGAMVKEDDTVGLIEVMKCFSSIKARIRGEIVKVCAQNAQMVEFGQELFLVRPLEKSEAGL